MKIHSVISIAFLVIFLTSCGDEVIKNEPKFRYFHAKVDNLFLPDSVSVSDSLIANLSGTLGPTGCYQFSNLEVSINENIVTIKVIGKEFLGGCIQVFMCLNEDYKLFGLKAGYQYFVIMNPGNQVIRDSVLIY